MKIPNNIDFDLGVGKIDITGSLLGSTKIDSGVGSTNVNIIGSKDDYKIDVDKGLGSINVDGESLKDNTSYGNGVNTIDIDGGVGSITINFNNETGDIFLYLFSYFIDNFILFYVVYFIFIIIYHY